MSIYATTDLHGRKDLYLKIKEILQPDDKVFFLGDANDRGWDGWELIKLIYNDPQFIYLSLSRQFCRIICAESVSMTCFLFLPLVPVSLR